MFSVSEVTRAVRLCLEENVGEVWVEGEIGNHRRQSSGHQYFTLKDTGAQLSCVFFARPGLRLRQVELAEGMCVRVRGLLTVYEARGVYQLNVKRVEAAGAGALAAKFEAMKRRLEAEGLFDQGRKRALPRFPKRVALVTSPTGAVIRDMLHVFERRAPWIELLVSPVRVQGAGAAAEIAAAIRELNDLGSGLPTVDVIVVARGGGSAEDLWEFNEEAVARAIFDSALPVVSAVGHETDFSIADFTADLRAPTPSAAAELIAPDGAELALQIQQLGARIQREAVAATQQLRAQIEAFAEGTLRRELPRRVAEGWQNLDGSTESLSQRMRLGLAGFRQRLEAAGGLLREHRPDRLLALRRQELDALTAHLAERGRRRLEEKSLAFSQRSRVLALLAPEATLRRGYTITMDADGVILRRGNQVPAGATLRTRFTDREIVSKTKSRAPGRARLLD